MVKAIIFDMDGVIIDSEGLHLQAEKEVFEKYNIIVDSEEWDGFRGMTSTEIFSLVLEKYNVNNVTVEELMTEKKTYYPRIKDQLILFNGFLELINSLKTKYKIALTTSSNKIVQEMAFNKFNLNPFFDVIVNADMVTHGKPNPEPYLLTLKKLGLNPEDCVVIEDSDNGITSAKSAGTKTIAVTHTLPKEKLQHADYIVDNLQEVMDLIQKQF